MRLTQDFRHTITNKLVKHRFDADQAALTAAADVLLADIVVWAWGSDYDTMCCIPAARLAAADGVRFEDKKTYNWFSISGNAMRPFPNDVSGGATYPRFKLKDMPADLAKRVLLHHSMQEDHDTKRSEAFGEIRRTLAGFTTVKQLYAAWPELASVVPMPDDAKEMPKSKALTVDLGQINELLRLKVTA